MFKATKVIFSIIAIVILLIVGLYFWIFHDGLSHNSNDWGNFGSYVGGFGGLLLSISLFYYTYKIDTRTRQDNIAIRSNKDKEQKIFMFLQQYNVIVPKIKQYNGIANSIATSTISERGDATTSNKNELANMLETEIYSAFNITALLAHSLNLSKMDEKRTIGSIDRVMQKWINEITNKEIQQ